MKTYGATFNNGAAALSYGKGTISGDVNVDVQGASLRVYTLAATSSGSLNPDLALALAKQTFPGIADRNHTAKTVSKGYAWYAQLMRWSGAPNWESQSRLASPGDLRPRNSVGPRP